MKRISFLFVLALLSIPLVKSQDNSQARKERLLMIDKRVTQLGDQIFSFWVKHGPDTKYGGFYGTLDENGNPTKPYDKGVIAQSRHLWAFSTWYKYKAPSKEVKDICDNLYQFLIKNFRDPESKEFILLTDELGKAKDTRKQRLYLLTNQPKWLDKIDGNLNLD